MAIVIAGMLDEREGALKIMKEETERKGHETLMIDMSIGTGAIVPALKADVGLKEIVAAAGKTVEEMRRLMASERDKAAFLLGEGVKNKVMEMHAAGMLEGIIAIGGMTGTLMSLPAMKALPFGLPKVLISSVAASPAPAVYFSGYFGLRDITVMHTVVDTVGMNRFVETLAVNAANAISGMVERRGAVTPKLSRPLIAITEFGWCEKGAHYLREILEREYEVVSFHANSVGDRAAVDFVSRGHFDAFIDLVPSSFGEYLLGGSRSAGPERLDASRELPRPYILTPCGFEFLGCGPPQRRDAGDPLWVSRKLWQRKLFYQDAVRVFARASTEEMEQTARAVAERLNGYMYKNKVRFLIPRKGFSALSVQGGPLNDPASDEAFIVALKAHLDPIIEVVEVDAAINSREFAAAVALTLSSVTDALDTRVEATPSRSASGTE